MPVRVAVGIARSEAALPCLSQACDESSARGNGRENFSGVEWDRDDLRERAHAAACSGAADKLVRYAAVDVSGYFVALFVCGLKKTKGPTGFHPGRRVVQYRTGFAFYLLLVCSLVAARQGQEKDLAANGCS